MGHLTQSKVAVDGTATVLIETSQAQDERKLIVTVKNDVGDYVLVLEVVANDLDIYNLHL